MGRGRRPRFYNVATQIEPRRSSRARRSPRTGLGSSGRRATHQARTVLCIALPVGIRTARNRPETTEWRHTASRRVRLHMPSGPLGSPKMAHAPGRGMAPFCRHRTIPGCPDAYRRFSARYNPRLMRGGPPRRTEACARRPPRTARSGGSICVATLQKRGLSPLPTHQPPLTPLERPTLPTAQGLAQAEKPNPACKGASPAPSLKPSAAHGQTDRPSREAATDGIGDQPRPQYALVAEQSTHQLISIAQVHAMAAGCFHRLSAQPHRDAPPRAQSLTRP